MTIAVFGLPGSGKSYFASTLAARLNAVLISSDAVRRQMNQDGKYDAPAKLAVYLQMLSLMEAAIKAHRKVVLDATFYKENIRKLFEDKAAALQQPLYYVEIRAAEGTIRDRVSRKRPDSEADAEAYIKVKNQFDPLATGHLVLYSDREPLRRMLDTALTYLHIPCHETE